MNIKRTFTIALVVTTGFGSLDGSEIRKLVDDGDPVAEKTGWITAHEWGVQDFDWNKGYVVPENLPKFIHTAKKPGIVESKPAPQPQMMSRKPILYFRSSFSHVKIDVDLGFRGATPYAWYPQATKYVPSAVPVRRNIRKEFIGGLSANPYQLSWDNLSLISNRIKRENNIPQVEAGHWIHQARDVDAMIVQNTKGEEEHYLFYEGAYNRAPDVTVIPDGKGDFSLINLSNWDLNQVVVVYRDTKKSVYSMTRLDILATAANVRVLHNHRKKVSTVLKFGETGKVSFKTGKGLSDNLREWMRSDIEINRQNGEGEELPKFWPHQLTKKETKALLDIWQKELFETEGITIVYRQSVAQLNNMIPLKITAPKGVSVKTSRCGLVVNKNIPLKQLTTLKEAIDRYCIDEATEADQKLLRDHKQRVLGMVQGELSIKLSKDAARILHLQRLQSLLSL